MASQEKSYQSIFVPEHKIDIANYITEIIICNYLRMIKKPRPASPFWRKDIASASPELQALCKKYQLELIGVKQLLKKFDADIIAKYYTESKRTGFKGLKKINQTKILEELSKLQTKKNTIPSGVQLEIVMELSEQMKYDPKPILRKEKSKINL